MGKGWPVQIGGYPDTQSAVFVTEISHLAAEGILPTTLHAILGLSEVDVKRVVVPSNGAETGPISSNPPLVHVIVVRGGGL